MGVEDNARGMIISSDDGFNFTKPEKAYGELSEYVKDPIYGLRWKCRFERTQIMMKGDNPYAMTCGAIGGKYKSSSAVIFEIDLEALNKK